MMRIAIVGRSQGLVTQVTDAVRAAGGHTRSFGANRSLLLALRTDSFDALLLEVHNPPDAIALVSRLSAEPHWHLPVLALVPEAAGTTGAEMLDAGADDFLVLPPEADVLLARLRALIRRAATVQSNAGRLAYGRFAFDMTARRMSVDGEPLDLTEKEFLVALLLFRSIGKPLSRSHIQMAVWGRELDPLSRTLDTHIARLRTKLALRPEDGYEIKSIYNFGYVLDQR